MNIYKNLAQNVINDFNLGSSVSIMQSRKYSKAFARRAARKYSSGRRSRDSLLTTKRATEKQIQRIAQRDVERKRFNTAIAQFSLTGTGGVFLNAMAAGDDNNNREGRQITMKGLNVCTGVVPTGTEASYGWWAIVLDRDPLPSWSVDQIYGGNSTDPVFVGRNPAYIDRFKVLKRCDFAVGSISSGQLPMWREYIDLESVLTEKEGRVRYSSTGAATGNVLQNALYFVYAISNQSGFSPSADPPLLTAEAQLVFID